MKTIILELEGEVSNKIARAILKHGAVGLDQPVVTIGCYKFFLKSGIVVDGKKLLKEKR